MRPFYRLCYTLVGWELALHPMRFTGRENVPAGGCMIVANHASFLDPTTVGWAIGHEIYYLGRRSLFKPPFWSRFLPICNVLPIDRDGHDIAGMRRIIKMMKAGRQVLLFPEGTRSPDGALQPAEPGAGLIAVKAGVPILPVRLFGTFESLSRHTARLRLHPIHVVIGQPYLPDLGAGRRPDYAAIAQEMMTRIAALA